MLISLLQTALSTQLASNIAGSLASDDNALIEAATQAEQSLLQTSEGVLIARIAAAVVILVVTMLVVHAVVVITRRFLGRVNKALPVTIFINIERVILWAVGIYIVLSACCGIDASGIIAALGVGGIALSLGLQDTISNVIGGLQLSMMGTLKKGDYVKIGTVEGVVHDIAWRETTIMGFSGEKVIIPNSEINSNTLVVMPPVRKIAINESIPYNAQEILNQRGIDAAALNALLEERITVALTAPAPEGMGLQLEHPVKIYLRETREYSVALKVVAWIAEDEEFDKLAVEDAITAVFANLVGNPPAACLDA